MDEQLICVLRRPTGLAALVSRRQQEFVRPRPSLVDKPEPLATIDPYREEVRRLGDRYGDRSSVLAGVSASWESLGHVIAFDAQTLFHVLHVLVHTLPDGEAPDIPPLKIEPPPPAFQPTAANPRAYRGTKTRPPKAKRMAPLDLRPHLCVPSDVNRLFTHLAPWLPDVRPLLAKADLAPDEFPHLIDAHGKAVDAYLQYCHTAGDRSVHDLPVPFRTHLLFWLRGYPWSAVANALALYWGLGLATQPPLLRCFARFLAELPVLGVLEWGLTLLQQPVSRRAAFAELLIQSSLQNCPPSERLREIISEVDRISPDHVYRHRMDTVLVSCRDKNLDYLFDGFRLAQRYQVEYEFDDVGSCDGLSMDAIEDFIEHVSQSTKPEARGRPRHALTLWEACAGLDGFNRILEHRPWKGLEPDVAYAAMELFRELLYHDLDEEARQAKWRILRDFAPGLFDLLRGIEPGYREKAVCYFRDLAWFWDEPERLAQNLERYRLLLPRLCRPPFAREVIPDALTSLTVLRIREWAELVGSEVDPFLKLEKECRRENDARLIAPGLEILAETAAAWTVKAFHQGPGYLCRAAHVLGCMGVTARREVVQSWQEHPLLTLDAEGMPVEKLVQEIERHRPADVFNPIPRKLRQAALATCPLRPGQVERGLRSMRASLLVTCIDLLRRLALDRLGQAVGPAPDTAAARHALCLQGFIRDNRRSLRRFLRAYFAGQDTYLTDHPVNRNWLARHPRIDAGVWLAGVQRFVRLPDSSPAYLAVEQNPLEVLRLGTYVGTCLGLGGMMAHSAAAVVLDINKRVVYARTATGTVLGRQLLALSEDERLVCFPVYPLDARPHLKQAFRDYDQALAQVLRVEIHDPNKEDGYAIARLVSSAWWDDDPWDDRAQSSLSITPFGLGLTEQPSSK